MTADDDITLNGQDLRSFGRRRGRKSSPRQVRLRDDLLPRVRINSNAPTIDRHGPTWLEIGFGGGEHLIHQACANPLVQFIGCEPFEDGVVKVLDAIETQSINNIQLHADDARQLLRTLPPACLDRVFILFPDPWPKKRHVKRRLVNTETLILVAQAMKPHAELRIGTDIPDYARTILISLANVPQLNWQAARCADWTIRPDDWPITRYEEKAVREGRRSCYLSFRRAPT